MKRRKLRISGVVLLALLLALLTASVGFAEAESTTYSVTITNLTDDDQSTYGQPLTPPLIATHRPSTGLFTVGHPASYELQQVAENGNLHPMLAALAADEHVSDVVVAPAGTPRPFCRVSR